MGKKYWEPYQRDFWIKHWETNAYSIQNKIDGNQRVGVKFSPVLRYIYKYSPISAKLLEAGCGMGQWVIYLAAKGYDIIGVDFADPIIHKLNKLYPNLKFLVGDVTNFDFNNESFDGILSWGVVEHFKDGPTQALDPFSATRVIDFSPLMILDLS